MLQTFQLVYGNDIISPILTTTREYGNWLEEVFDNSICNMELYMKSKKNDGTSVLEKHPGTRIGAFFDKLKSQDPELNSCMVLEQSKVVDRLVRLKLAEKKDVIPISVNDVEGRRMLRLYTVKQVELYIKSKIDSSFKIADYIGIPKQVKVDKMEYIIHTKPSKTRKKLF